MDDAPAQKPMRVLGRYALYGKLASGGMATVHYGRLLGPVGFSRTVAIKRLHPQFSKDPEFAAMFLDEARVAARIQHPNVAATVDVVATEGELFLVMDYIRGETLSRLARAARRRGLGVPLGVIGSILSGALHGLHAAHEATDTHGKALEVVHRDVSPQNILVGADGVPRVLDFGVAKAAARVQTTRDGQMKGKLSYMSPEQLRGSGVDRRTDIFAAAVVLWEALTGKRLFDGDDAAAILDKILERPIPPPSSIEASIPRKVDRVTLQGLARNSDERFATAREFAVALEEAIPIASGREVGEWVEAVAGETLSKREKIVAEIESISAVSEITELTDSADPILKTIDARLPTAREPTTEKTSPSELVRRSVVEDEEATTLYRGEKEVVVPGLPGPPSAPGASAAPIDAPPPASGDVSTDVALYRRTVDSRRRQLRAVGVGVLAAFLIAGVVVLVVGSRSAGGDAPPEGDAERSARSPAPPSPPAEPTPTEAPAGAVEVDSLPVEEPPEAPEPAPAKKTPAAGAKGGVRRPSAPKAPPPREKPAAPKQAKTCDPPYYFDSKGIRRIKPQCL